MNKIKLFFISFLFLLSFTSFIYAHNYLGPEHTKYFPHNHKGEHNTHTGWYPGGLDEAGGPDTFGYIYTDSNEEDGPEYSWIDISTSGTEINNLGDDDYVGPFDLPWDFSFYGVSYSEIYICSNGFLQFDGGSDEFANTIIPDITAPNNILAFFWDDLNPETGGEIFYQTVDNQWICQFENIREYGSSGTISAEVILDENGTITFQYNTLGNAIDIDGETIGIENGDGTIGLMVSLDDTPAEYPTDELAIRFSNLDTDASISGTVTNSEDNSPIANAVVEFGNVSAVTDDDGNYSIEEFWSGSYNVHVYADGFFDYRAEDVLVNTGANTFDYSLEESGYPAGLVGSWQFDDAENPLAASTGNDLVLVGTHNLIEGPNGEDGAINIGTGSYYRCYHDISPNGAFGNAEWVNQYTIVMDFRISDLNQWYCFFQTNYDNGNDGDCFINPDGNVGVGDTGYSQYEVIEDEWYRLAVTANLGVEYNYYLDGALLQIGGAQGFEGRFALYPEGNGNQVLFFADNNGEDNPIDVAQILLFDRNLTTMEIMSLGGYGHEFESPGNRYNQPYLQTPTPNSLYVCWHSPDVTDCYVEYGITEDLGSTLSGDYHQFSNDLFWNWVQLTDLEPNTTYYYRVVSDQMVSEISAFTTQQPDGDEDSDVVFATYSDTQTANGHQNIVQAMHDKFVELYGENFHEEIQLVLLSGDILNNGNTLNQYSDLYFNNIATISDNVPYMVTIGNHEAEAEHYYNYMKYEDIAGAEGERYYSFWIGNVLFICLNSNIQGNTQLNWLEDLLETADNDEDIDWIFTFLHHPGHSESWPDGNTSWVQDQVIPLLSSYDKTEQLTYGHTHAFERGATNDGHLRLMCMGGGGGHLDRWRMYTNQQDYLEINRSHDYYGYALFTINNQEQRYDATVYTLGNEDHPIDNQVLDSWYRDRSAEPPETPQTLFPIQTGDIPTTLTLSPISSEYPVRSIQFQVTDIENFWNQTIIDTMWNWENIYYDTGSPDFEPIDQNEGIDLQRLNIPDNILEEGETYWWRARYRDRNLQWSQWAEAAEFDIEDIPDAADFIADRLTSNETFTAQFTDLSTGQPSSWEWDLDGDGEIDSDERDPQFTYTEPGNYTVTLTTVINGQQFTETKVNYISHTGSDADESGLVPENFNVGNFYPNPFNPVTSVKISLPEARSVKMIVFNMMGQEIESIDYHTLEAGYHNLSFNASSMSSGIYFIQLDIAGQKSETRKIIFMK